MPILHDFCVYPCTQALVQCILASSVREELVPVLVRPPVRSNWFLVCTSCCRSAQKRDAVKTDPSADVGRSWRKTSILQLSTVSGCNKRAAKLAFGASDHFTRSPKKVSISDNMSYYFSLFNNISKALVDLENPREPYVPKNAPFEACQVSFNPTATCSAKKKERRLRCASLEVRKTVRLRAPKRERAMTTHVGSKWEEQQP